MILSFFGGLIITILSFILIPLAFGLTSVFVGAFFALVGIICTELYEKKKWPLMGSQKKKVALALVVIFMGLYARGVLLAFISGVLLSLVVGLTFREEKTYHKLWGYLGILMGIILFARFIA